MARHRQNKYGYKITLDCYNQMSDKQGGKCAICGGRNKNGKTLSVDHNHETGFIRGLLCGNCNVALGCARDNVLILLKMAEYLEKARDAEDIAE